MDEYDNKQPGTQRQQNIGSDSYDSYNEYSYNPPKKKKDSGKTVNIILAFLCIGAIGISSAVGISMLNVNEKTNHDPNVSAERTKVAPDAATSQNSTEEVSRNTDDLPTIISQAAPEDALSIPDIVKKVSPSVVGISCITNGAQVSGTGIVMSEDGYVITNAHVVDGASAISVVVTDTTANNTKESDDSSKTIAEQILEKQNGMSNISDDNAMTAQLIGIDAQTDLAVLKIDTKGLQKAEFGTSDELLVGELAIVIGNPLGFDLANTVTSGIISATDRTLTIEDRTMNLIQTDASINSGNSGGPLINAYGQVIGITSAKVSSEYGEGLGFAIPIDEAKTIIDDLIKYGYVKGRPTVGISGTNINSFYAQYYSVPQGFIVRSVESGSAAEAAGIQVNDIVVGIEGHLINSMEEFNEIKEQYKAGDEISVSIWRDNATDIFDVKVILDESKKEDTPQNNQNQDYNNNKDYYGNWNDFFPY